MGADVVCFLVLWGTLLDLAVRLVLTVFVVD